MTCFKSRLYYEWYCCLCVQRNTECRMQNLIEFICLNHFVRPHLKSYVSFFNGAPHQSFRVACQSHFMEWCRSLLKSIYCYFAIASIHGKQHQFMLSRRLWIITLIDCALAFRIALLLYRKRLFFILIKIFLTDLHFCINAKKIWLSLHWYISRDSEGEKFGR